MNAMLAIRAEAAVRPPHQREMDGDEHVAADELGEGDVPPLPEIDDIAGQVGAVEVLGSRHSDQLTDADGEVAVCAEIQIEPDISELDSQDSVRPGSMEAGQE